MIGTLSFRPSAELKRMAKGWRPVAFEWEERQFNAILSGQQAHSFLEWRDGYRDGDHLTAIHGAMYDFDDGEVDLFSAIEMLKKLNIQAVVYPSKSHLKPKSSKSGKTKYPAVDRFHVLIPFATPALNGNLDKACRIIEAWGVRFLGRVDPSGFDKARFFYPGLPGAPVHVLDGPAMDLDAMEFPLTPEDYAAAEAARKKKKPAPELALETEPDETPTVKPNKQIPKKQTESDPKEFYDPSLIVKTHQDVSMEVRFIEKKSAVYCPFHDDGSPSAFVGFTQRSNLQFLHCSSCGKTWWSRSWQARYKDYFFIGAGLHMITRQDDHCSFSAVSPQAVVAPDTKERAEFLSRLARHPLSNSFSVEHLKRADLAEPDGRIENDHLIFDHPTIRPKIKDNDFVLRWIQGIFPEDWAETFILDWMAAYVWTNYRRLPILLLTGPRGSGKNTFAETMMGIFPQLGGVSDGSMGTYNDELEKCLVLIDENETDKRAQYTLMKRLTGNKFVSINRKYGQRFQMRANHAIIMASNERQPMFLKKTEAPTDEANNQWFIYHMAEVEAAVRDAKLDEKLLDRMGHFCATFLRDRWEALQLMPDIDRYRYSIPVPITEETRSLFANSATAMEEEACDLYAAFWMKRFGKTYVSQEIRCIQGVGDVIHSADIKAMVKLAGYRESPLYYRRVMQQLGLISLEEVRKNLFRGYLALAPVDFDSTPTPTQAFDYTILTNPREIREWEKRELLKKLPIKS